LIGLTIWTAYHSIGIVSDIISGTGVLSSILENKKTIAIWLFGFVQLKMGMLAFFAAMNLFFLLMIVFAIWVSESSGDLEKTKILSGGLKFHGIVSIASLALS